MSVVHAETRYDYDEVTDALETEVLHLNALKMAQEPGTTAWAHYQDRIDTLTGRVIALQVVRPQLEHYDRRIVQARREAKAAQGRADRAMDTAWGVVKFAGTPALIGALWCMIWVPTVWLPIITVTLLVIALGAVGMTLRSRSGLYERADRAAAAATRLETERQTLLGQAEAGQYPPVVMAERVAPDRVPLRLVPTESEEPIEADVVDEN